MKFSKSFWVVISILLIGSAIITSYYVGALMVTRYNNLNPKVIYVGVEPEPSYPTYVEATTECRVTFEVLAPTTEDLSDFQVIPMVIPHVNEETTLVLGLILENLRQAHQNKVLLNISTPGGSIMNMYAVYDLIMQYRRMGMTIYTCGNGYVLSAGSVIMQAGEKRFLSQNGIILIHSGYITNPNGVSPTAEAEWREIDALYMNPRAMAIFMLRSNNNLEVKNILLTRGDHWINPKDALRMGLIDGVL